MYDNKYLKLWGGLFFMDIALIADDNKKELMAQFCIAYSGILARHHL